MLSPFFAMLIASAPLSASSLPPVPSAPLSSSSSSSPEGVVVAGANDFAPKADWVAGAGINVGNLGQIAVTPAIVGVLEHRFGDDFFLGAAVGGGVDHSEFKITPASDAAFPVPVQDAWAVAATLSVRDVLNPGMLVEVSPFVDVGAAYASSHVTLNGPADRIDPTFPTQSTSTTLSAGVGVAAEHWFTKNVALRLATTLASGTYAWTDARAAAADGSDGAHSQQQSWAGALVLEPTVALVAAF